MKETGKRACETLQGRFLWVGVVTAIFAVALISSFISAPFAAAKISLTRNMIQMSISAACILELLCKSDSCAWLSSWHAYAPLYRSRHARAVRACALGADGSWFYNFNTPQSDPSCDFFNFSGGIFQENRSSLRWSLICYDGIHNICCSAGAVLLSFFYTTA